MTEAPMHDMEVPSDAELVAMQRRGELPSDAELASDVAARTPYPPDRTCPECGEQVGRHDGMLYCRRECHRNELARYDLEHEATEVVSPHFRDHVERLIRERGWRSE